MLAQTKDQQIGEIQNFNQLIKNFVDVVQIKFLIFFQSHQFKIKKKMLLDMD